VIIAHHLVLSGYGTWLSNDIRGSGSDETRKEALRTLGPIHRGRCPRQPTRDQLRAFFRDADPLLDFRPLWFDDAMRDAIGFAFGEVARERGYPVWGCAVLRNHAHLGVRVHRDDALAMRDAFANASRAAVLALGRCNPNHPVWSSRPYKVFLDTPEAVVAEVHYIWKNPVKEGLPAQNWDFVQPYNGWPFHKHR
jgi:hypothetical protein